MKFNFELEQEVYQLECSGYYFYIKSGKVKSYSIYKDKILYKVDGSNFYGEYSENELLTKEEVIEKIKKWLR